MAPVSDRLDLVFIMRELAPYWVEALDCLGRAWAPYGRLTVLSGGLLGDELHPWKDDSIPLRHAQFRLIPPHARRHWGGTIWPPIELWQELERIRPSVVVIQEYSPYVVLSGLVWAKAWGHPCVVTTDVGPMQRDHLTWLQRRVHTWVNRSVDGILARTQDALDLARLMHRPALLAPHAVGVPQSTPAKPSGHVPFRLIQVGSLIHRKGVDLLLAAFARVRRYRPDAELALVGAGDHGVVRQEAERLGISPAVVILDFLQPDELARQYQKSDVFVLASRFDSYDVVVHEAAAAGLPLIISKHAGASATLVVAGQNGFQVDPEDTEGFAELILQVLEPETNRRFGEHSRVLAQATDAEHVALRTASWLRQVHSAHSSEDRDESPQGNRLLGLARWIKDAWTFYPEAALGGLAPDAFDSSRRTLVFINRYIPFYREGIFRKVMQWRRTLLLYSGKTLGNLKSVESVEHAAVPFLEIQRGGQRNIIWLGGTLRLLQARPRVVCTEMSLSLLSTWWWLILRRLLGFGLVFWTHGFQENGWRGDRLSWKDRVRLLWMRWADAVVFYSQDRREAVEEITGKLPHFFVAPNTLDTQAYSDYMQVLECEGREDVRKRMGVSRPSMVYVGRITAEKDVLGLADLLKATAQSSQAPDLIVIGGGELEKALEEACSTFASRVQMLGPIFDPSQRSRWIYAADIMVCPGCAGLNVVDALALGCPFATVNERCLSRRHGPEISYVRHGQNGIIAPSLAELGAALCRWFERGQGIALDRKAIRKAFLQESSIERQFEGLKSALMHAIGENP